jgi:hypothetical protein
VEVILLHEDPGTLANWLYKLAAPSGEPPVVPVLEVEAIGKGERSKVLREALHDRFMEIVSEVVRPDPSKVFASSDLADDLATFRRRRAIVAVHDLTTGIETKDYDTAISELKRKLDPISEMISEYEYDHAKVGVRVFKCLLVVQKAGVIRGVKYLSGLFRDWHLLAFKKATKGRLEPTQGDKELFNSYLDDWVKEQ